MLHCLIGRVSVFLLTGVLCNRRMTMPLLAVCGFQKLTFVCDLGRTRGGPRLLSAGYLAAKAGPRGALAKGSERSSVSGSSFTLAHSNF
jgi:hypothetical protein